MIYTSYFRKYIGTSGVSVAKSTPEWFGPCESCKELMPSWDLIEGYKSGEISWKQYRKEYIRQLKNLDVKEFYNRLNGKVLLCWENEGKHCHRHIIREWFNRNGYSCEELKPIKEKWTCSYCRNLDNHSSSSIFCRLTGEIFTNAQQLSRTCKEWRGRNVTKTS